MMKNEENRKAFLKSYIRLTIIDVVDNQESEQDGTLSSDAAADNFNKMMNQTISKDIEKYFAEVWGEIATEVKRIEEEKKTEEAK